MSEPGMIGQYRIGERIAVGGAGEIYAASDTKVGRDVAIKFLRPELASDPEWVGRFFAEAKRPVEPPQYRDALYALSG